MDATKGWKQFAEPEIGFAEAMRLIEGLRLMSPVDMEQLFSKNPSLAGFQECFVNPDTNQWYGYDDARKQRAVDYVAQQIGRDQPALQAIKRFVEARRERALRSRIGG